MLGFGSIGQAMLPLLFRHLDIESTQLKIISADEDKTGIAAEFGAQFTVQALTGQTFKGTVKQVRLQSTTTNNADTIAGTMSFITGSTICHSSRPAQWISAFPMNSDESC